MQPSTLDDCVLHCIVHNKKNGNFMGLHRGNQLHKIHCSQCITISWQSTHFVMDCPSWTDVIKYMYHTRNQIQTYRSIPNHSFFFQNLYPVYWNIKSKIVVNRQKRMITLSMGKMDPLKNSNTTKRSIEQLKGGNDVCPNCNAPLQWLHEFCQFLDFFCLPFWDTHASYVNWQTCKSSLWCAFLYILTFHHSIWMHCCWCCGSI